MYYRDRCPLYPEAKTHQTAITKIFFNNPVQVMHTYPRHCIFPPPLVSISSNTPPPHPPQIVSPLVASNNNLHLLRNPLMIQNHLGAGIPLHHMPLKTPVRSIMHTAQFQRLGPVALPRPHRISRADVLGGVTSLLGAETTSSTGGFLIVVLDQRGEGGHVGDDDTEIVFHGGPEDQRGRVEVVGQLLDGLDADDLDDGDEEAETKEAEEDELFAVLDAGFDEDGEGGEHTTGENQSVTGLGWVGGKRALHNNVKDDGEGGHAGVEGHSLDAGSFCDGWVPL